MQLEIENICYLLEIDGYCNQTQLQELTVYTNKNNLNDLFAIKKHIPCYKNMVVVEKTTCQNKINDKIAMEYFLRGHLPFFGHNIWNIGEVTVPFDLNFDYIYVEDFDNLDDLEIYADIMKAKIFSTKSFKRRSNKVFSFKSQMTILEKIHLVKNAKFYFGYDYSCLAPIAKHFLSNKVKIYKTNKLSDEELMFRFINEDNIDFFDII